MWSFQNDAGINRGEGIFNDFNFEVGKCYQISFRIRVFDDNVAQIRNQAVVNFEAINNLTSSSSYPIPNPPQNTRESILASGYSNYPNNTWTTQTVIYTPSSNFSQIWIYPRYDGRSINNGQAELSIDDVEITETTINLNPSFTDNVYCAPDGTISIAVSSNNTGGNHWYGLYETNTPNSTSGGTYITHVGGGPNFLSHTFTGLSRIKNYYVKHGMYGNCSPWVEKRRAFSGDVLWSPRTADFSFDTILVNGNNLSVTVSAAPNGVSVNHWWAVLESVNGSITGNNMVSGTSVQFGTPTTFTNLQINTWYYIKHGIYNDCAGWTEKRRAFRVQISNKSSKGETTTYEVEEAVNEEIRLSTEYVELTEEALKTYPFYNKEESGIGTIDIIEESRSEMNLSEPAIELFPNPARQGSEINIVSPALKIKSLSVMDLSGNPYDISVEIASENEMKLSSIKQLEKGIYIVKIETENGSVLNKRVIVE